MPRRLPIAILALCWVAGASHAGETAAVETPVHGPYALRVQNPLWLQFYRLPPSDASIPGKGEGSVALASYYSSLFRIDSSNDGRNFAVLDGEIWRNTLQLRLGLGHGLALAAAIPAVYGSGGFLDSLIENYHDLFGFNQAGRDKNPNDVFRFDLARDGQLAFQMPDETLRLGDASLLLEWLGKEESAAWPAVLLRLGVELPTGDEESGYGNGQTDWAVGVATTKRLGRYRVFGDLGYQLPEAPRRFADAGVEVRNVWSANGGVERALGRTVAIVGQIGFEQSPILRVMLPAADENSLWVALGLTWWPASRWSLDFVFQEDLEGASTQDFTAHFGVGRRF